MSKFEAGILGAAAIAAVMLVAYAVQADGNAVLAVLMATLLAGVAVELRHIRRQPVSKPVVKPAETTAVAVAQPAVRVNHYRTQPAQPAWPSAKTISQPPETDPQPPPQPAGSAEPGMVEALGAMGATEWYQEMGRDEAPPSVSPKSPGFERDDLPTWEAMVAAAAEIGVPAASPDRPVAAADRPLLDRQPPRMADYPVIDEVIRGTRSLNEAIRILWGSKDGKTWAWLTSVRDCYAEHGDPTRADIIGWELESGDDVIDVAERLGVSVEEVEAVFDGGGDGEQIR